MGLLLCMPYVPRSLLSVNIEARLPSEAKVSRLFR